MAAKGLNSSSPPVFSLMLAHQALNVFRPTPAGQEVCTFQVVVVAARALPMKGAPMTAAAPAVAATPVLTKLRRAATGWFASLLMCLLVWLK